MQFFIQFKPLALQEDFATSKHSTLLGWFNKSFIKTGKLEIKIGKIYTNTFLKRQEGDYDDFVFFEKEEVETNFKNMLEVINEIKKLI